MMDWIETEQELHESAEAVIKKILKELLHPIGIMKFLTFRKSYNFHSIDYHFQLFYGKNRNPI